MPHHRAAWRVERMGWAVMALALLGALLGVFGDGPLSRTTAGSPSALAVEYERFQRSSAPQTYRFYAHPSLARGRALTLRFSQSLVDEMELDSIVPEPESVRAASGYTDFSFVVQPGSDPMQIVFRFQPATFGRRSGTVTVEGAPPITIGHYIYP